MPAQILVETGLTAGTRYWIEKNVTRIGSGSGADICLPSSQIPSHAITLEFRDGGYRVYNRTRRGFRLGKTDIAAGENSPWTGGSSLVLPDETSLALELEGDPAPAVSEATKPEEEDYDIDPVVITASDQDAEQAPRRKKTNFKSIAQILLLVFCAVASWYLLNLDTGRKMPAQSVLFEKIVQAGLKDERTSQLLLQKLKYAQAALVRKDVSTAKRLFSRLRSQLIAQKPQFVAEKRKVELAILNYVQYQHQRLP